MNDAIFRYKDADLMLEKIGQQEKILVGGCFDILHYGHFLFLKQARQFNGAMIVALESDEHILKYKKRKPIHNQQERAEILNGLSMVDYVIKLPFINNDKGYEQLVSIVKPRYIPITKGDIYKSNKIKHAKLIGAEVVEVTPFVKDFSSSKILEVLQKTT